MGGNFPERAIAINLTGYKSPLSRLKEPPTITRLSYRCGTAATPLVYDTIGRLFDRTADAHAERDALIVPHQGIHWTYAEYRNLSVASISVSQFVVAWLRCQRR